MTRILMFGCKNPLLSVSPEETLDQDLLRSNSGNLLFSHSAYRSLAGAGTEVTVSNFDGLEKRAAWVNRNFDHVVLPFANAFRRGYETRLERFSELIEKLRVPVTVLGIGAQSTVDLSLEPLAPLAPIVSRFIRSVLERSPSVGVRGEFTAHYLRTLGFTDVEVIGCPSMFLKGSELHVRPTDSALAAGDLVAVNASRRDGPWMDDLLERARAEHRLVYVPQGAADLELLLWGEPRWDADDRGVPLHLSHPMFREDKVRFFIDPSTWLDAMADFAFCFGTRIHGNVAALLAGTPAHVIAHDSRTLELARYFEIPHTQPAAITSTTSARDLLERSDFRPLVANHAARFDRFVAFLDQHALPHSLSDPDTTARFDHVVSQVPFPPPIRPLIVEDHTELASRLHRLRDRQERRHKRLSARIDKLEKRVRTLSAPPAVARGAASRPRVPAQQSSVSSSRAVRRRMARLLVRAREGVVPAARKVDVQRAE